MKIGITLNEVVRDFIGQFAYTYSKYETEISLKDNPVTSWDLLEYFNFPDMEALNKFLYTEASLEIFGHADQLHDNVVTKLNNFITDIIDEEEHEVIIISREANRSIPATLFFLSKLGFTGNNIRFVLDTAKKWDGIDVLVTANPVALQAKPEGKISVKVSASYNQDVEADYTIETIMELFDNEELLKQITTV
jgi:hypothetical protein